MIFVPFGWRHLTGQRIFAPFGDHVVFGAFSILLDLIFYVVGFFSQSLMCVNKLVEVNLSLKFGEFRVLKLWYRSCQRIK